MQREVKEIHGGGMKRQRRQFFKNESHKALCQNSTEDNKRRHKSLKKKAVSKTMREA